MSLAFGTPDEQARLQQRICNVTSRCATDDGCPAALAERFAGSLGKTLDFNQCPLRVKRVAVARGHTSMCFRCFPKPDIKKYGYWFRRFVPMADITSMARSIFKEGAN
jgi:hypothetical protein